MFSEIEIKKKKELKLASVADLCYGFLDSNSSRMAYNESLKFLTSLICMFVCFWTSLSISIGWNAIEGAIELKPITTATREIVAITSVLFIEYTITRKSCLTDQDLSAH